MNDNLTGPSNGQTAPFPDILKDLVERTTYRKWKLELANLDRGQGSKGLTLVITTLGVDSYHPEDGETYRVNHYFPVPPAAFNYKSWRWWLFQRFIEVETHESMEFFKVDGKRPFAPHHGPGNDPYMVFERGTEEEARIMFTGRVNPPTYRPRDRS